MNFYKNRGFTLIELLVVIAIIAILASITLISLNSARNKGSSTRIRAEIGQIRIQLEQNFSNNSYADLVGSPGHDASLAVAGIGLDNLTTLICDIGSLNAYPSTVTDDLTLTCDGVAGLHTGVVIYSTGTGTSVPNYGIYATTTPSGYVCLDSYGNSVASTSGSIPAYSDISQPTTALCR